MKKISLIVPCFNEEDTVDAFYKKTVEVWQKLNQYELEIVYVDDGSKDRTLQKIETRQEKDIV